MTKLAVVESKPPAEAQPPPTLGEHGAQLWRDVMASYQFDDPASLGTLGQACAAVDLAGRCHAAIIRDGLMLKTRTGIRDNPLIKNEIASRALACRLLARLGLDLEPIRDGPGRPPKAIG